MKYHPAEVLKAVIAPWRKLQDFTSPCRLRQLWCILIGALLVLIGLPSLTGFLERPLLDLWIDSLRLLRAPSENIILVALDADTLAYIPERWPWPRKRFAQIADAIASGNPRILIWDFTLDHLEAEDGSEGDRLLAAAFRRFDYLALVSTIDIQVSPDGVRKRLFRNAPLFRNHASSEGFAFCPVDSDGVFRRFALQDGSLGCGGCAWQVFRALTGNFSEISPLDSHGLSTSFLAFASKGGEIPSIKAVDLLTGTVSPEVLKGKIVIFGPTAAVLQDYHATSRGSIAGPRILASSLDTLISHRTTRVLEGLTVRGVLGSLGAGLGIAISAVAVSHPFLWSLAGLCCATILWGIIFTFVGIHLPWGALAASWLLFSSVQSSLRDFLLYMDEREHLAEATAAARVQSQLFPAKPWDRGEFRIQGYCQPCLSVGGDYYDILPMSQDRVMFIIADVTGHGISAAMITCMVKALVGILVELDQLSPEEFSRHVSSFLYKTFRGRKLMTAMIGILYYSSNRVTIVNAGQCPAILVRGDGKIEELGQPSTPLGVKGRSVDFFQAVAMGPGDSLVLSTDGIPEALDREEKQYGYEAWKTFLGATLPHFPNDAPLSELLEGVQTHAGGRPQDDDITLVVVRRRVQTTN